MYSISPFPEFGKLPLPRTRCVPEQPDQRGIEEDDGEDDGEFHPETRIAVVGSERGEGSDQQHCHDQIMWKNLDESVG